MLRFPTGATTDCEGFSRREFLEVGSLSALGLSLAGLLRSQAGEPSAHAVDSRSRDDLSVILLWMGGGPSHLDTFDPKPDAPAEIRGEFGTIPTRLPGIHFTDLLPLLAQRTDKFSILRSVTSSENNHQRATHYLLTGYPFSPALEYPSMGSVVSREQGFRAGMPPYVLLGSYPFGYGGAGFLGNQYNPFSLQEDPSRAGFTVRDVSPPAGVDGARILRRRDMLEAIDTFQRRVELAAVDTLDAFYEKAYDLVTSPRAKQAFELDDESPRVRERYGSNRFGQSCLLARRLVEAGVRFVTINSGGWDTHQNNFRSLRRRLPELDLGYSALLDDLDARGLLETTLVVWMGEFGRTPKVNPSAGRDHWARAMCVNLGGGGVKTGHVIGSTDERAEEPRERPIRVEDTIATIYTALGIDGDKEYVSPQNRPLKINYDGEPVHEIL